MIVFTENIQPMTMDEYTQTFCLFTGEIHNRSLYKRLQVVVFFYIGLSDMLGFQYTNIRKT